MEKFANIPTIYNGIQMRSRLEARWAAFFDLCGWTWEYEPVDLNGWIPDFILLGRSRKIYVEVKPYFELFDWKEMIEKILSLYPKEANTCNECQKYIKEVLPGHKIISITHRMFCEEQMKWEQNIPDIILLGANLSNGHFGYLGYERCYLGLTNRYWEDKWWEGAEFFIPEKGKFDFYCSRPYNGVHNDHSFIYDLDYEHGHNKYHLGMFTDRLHARSRLIDFWKEAGNMTQWKGRRK